MKLKFKDYLYYVLIFIVLLFIIWASSYIISNKEAFFENPFIFGAEKMGNVECSCVQKLEDGKFARFRFNDTEIEFLEGEKYMGILNFTP